MSTPEGQLASDISVDVDNLYREETFTDLRAASIRRLSPVTADGEPDTARQAMYVGDTNIMTQMGPLPVQFNIEAADLAEAFAKFPEGVAEALERLNDRAREMAREEASRIVVPSAAPPGMGGAPGAGPGGKLILDR